MNACCCHRGVFIFWWIRATNLNKELVFYKLKRTHYSKCADDDLRLVETLMSIDILMEYFNRHQVIIR